MLTFNVSSANFINDKTDTSTKASLLADTFVCEMMLSRTLPHILQQDTYQNVKRGLSACKRPLNAR